MPSHRPLRLVEFRGGPLDDQCHLVPTDGPDPEDGVIEVVVDDGGVRTARYEWTDIHGAGAVVYVFQEYRDG